MTPERAATRFWVETHPSRPKVAVDIDADGIAHVTCSGKDWRFEMSTRGMVNEVSDHLASAEGREDARELALMAFEKMVAS
jgi:hypothetical protein